MSRETTKFGVSSLIRGSDLTAGQARGSGSSLYRQAAVPRFRGAADDKSVSIVAVERGAVAMAGDHQLQEQTTVTGTAREPTDS
jgi:hypothetical protein